MALHFANVCIFILLCFFVGTYQSTLDSEPIMWAAPGIRHFCITQLIFSFIVIAVDTAALAWYEKTYLEADEKTYD